MIEQLISGARQGVDARRRELPQADLEARLSGRGEDRPFSEALTRIFNAASGVDEKTMALQYLEALKALGASPSTKYIIPAEVTRWIEPLAGYIEKGITKPAG